MTKFVKRLFILLTLCIIISGCLTPEYKEYRYSVNPDGSGSGSITYINLVSTEEEGENISNSDFVTLINDYLYGEEFEIANPSLTVTDKRLYEEDDMLIGVVEFTFTNYFECDFQDHSDDDGNRVGYFLDDITEEVIASNGQFDTGEGALPVVKWEQEYGEYYIKTIAQKDMTFTNSMMGHYKKWITPEE